MNTYKRHRFPADIISYAVWLYYRFNLSHRYIEDILADQGEGKVYIFANKSTSTAIDFPSTDRQTIQTSAGSLVGLDVADLNNDNELDFFDVAEFLEAYSAMDPIADFTGDGMFDFFDVAELYPVPATAETYPETERIIGNWFKKTGNRDQVVLASKIAGPGDYTAHIRTNGFSKEALNDAVEHSLKRLKTDYIDLYQLHWPERQTNMFGVRDYAHNPEDISYLISLLFHA